MQLMGLHGHEMAKKLVEIYELPLSPSEYYSLALKQYSALMPSCELMPGNYSIFLSLQILKFYIKELLPR